MKSIKLLDCTLRDGGYINNWNFGKEHIEDTVRLLEESKVDILELGFLRDEECDSDRTVFPTVEAINKLISKKKHGITYAAMAEAIKPVTASSISRRTSQSIDAIRVIIWKDRHDSEGRIVDALQDGFEYCKLFVDKGYELFVQPARVEQYSDEEFVRMLKLYSQLNPRAIYIVDSWGTMFPEEVNHYLKLADENLPSGISIGFHGHNNMMQALSNSIEFISTDIERELILDASVYGSGRGAGNLNIEIMAQYLNEHAAKEYNVSSFLKVYENTVRKIGDQYFWGYNRAYFLTAMFHTNPQYGTYYGLKCNIDSVLLERILKKMSNEDKVIYSEEKADYYMSACSSED